MTGDDIATDDVSIQSNHSPSPSLSLISQMYLIFKIFQSVKIDVDGTIIISPLLFLQDEYGGSLSTGSGLDMQGEGEEQLGVDLQDDNNLQQPDGSDEDF